MIDVLTNILQSLEVCLLVIRNYEDFTWLDCRNTYFHLTQSLLFYWVNVYTDEVMGFLNVVTVPSF